MRMVPSFVYILKLNCRQYHISRGIRNAHVRTRSFISLEQTLHHYVRPNRLCLIEMCTQRREKQNCKHCFDSCFIQSANRIYCSPPSQLHWIDAEKNSHRKLCMQMWPSVCAVRVWIDIKMIDVYVGATRWCDYFLYLHSTLLTHTPQKICNSNRCHS